LNKTKGCLIANFATVPYLSLHHKIMNDRSMAVLFSYARQGMEGDRAGLNRPPAANRRKPQR